jgi:hypothetical protein
MYNTTLKYNICNTRTVLCIVKPVYRVLMIVEVQVPEPFE